MPIDCAKIESTALESFFGSEHLQRLEFSAMRVVHMF